MKIKQITDEHNLIHSFTLLKINEYDYKLIVEFNHSAGFVFTPNGFRFYSLLQEPRTFATIECDILIDGYSKHVDLTVGKRNLFSIILENLMKTKLIEVIERYGN